MENSRKISFGEAVREALALAMERDSSVFLMGEGIGDPSSFFGTTKGLAAQFGNARAVEMPVAENGMVGVAVGAAMMGQRPVLSLHRVEFALLAIEQIVNNAAKSHYVSNGKHTVPLVIRLIVGRGWGQGPEHSQSLEAVFGHFPGLKVIMPTMPADAKGMLLAAIEDNNPVVVIEHRWLHSTVGHVPEEYYTTPLTGPAILRPGRDVTVVATAQATLEAVRAADILADHGVSAEIVDLRVVRPLNLAPIEESVSRTGRLITIDTGSRTYGVGAEICASVAENCHAALRSGPVRLGLPDHPTPSSRGLIPGFYPDAIKLVEKIGAMLSLPAGTVESMVRRLCDLNGDQPVDTPNPFFKGPF
jgi:pyruvate dehydrogenase E1 component beta subunit